MSTDMLPGTACHRDWVTVDDFSDWEAIETLQSLRFFSSRVSSLSLTTTCKVTDVSIYVRVNLFRAVYANP